MPRTLYLRNVPDDVVQRLEKLAAREGRSVSATAIRELDAATRRVTNDELYANLPDHGAGMDAIVAMLRQDRESH